MKKLNPMSKNLSIVFLSIGLLGLISACQSEPKSPGSIPNESNGEVHSEPTEPEPHTEEDPITVAVPTPKLETLTCEPQNLLCIVRAQKLSEIQSVFEHEFQRYSYLSNLYLKKDHLGQNPKELSGIPDFVINNGQEELSELERYVRTLAITHEKCLQDQDTLMPSCTLPREPILRYLDWVSDWADYMSR